MVEGYRGTFKGTQYLRRDKSEFEIFSWSRSKGVVELIFNEASESRRHTTQMMQLLVKTKRTRAALGRKWVAFLKTFKTSMTWTTETFWCRSSQIMMLGRRLQLLWMLTASWQSGFLEVFCWCCRCSGNERWPDNIYLTSCEVMERQILDSTGLIYFPLNKQTGLVGTEEASDQWVTCEEIRDAARRLQAIWDSSIMFLFIFLQVMCKRPDCVPHVKVVKTHKIWAEFKTRKD